MIVYTTPGIIASLWLTRFHESPQFLLMKNQLDKALIVMKWINKTNKGNANCDDLVIAKCEVQSNNTVTNDKNT